MKKEPESNNKKLEKKIDKVADSVDHLAQITARGFDGVEKRLVDLEDGQKKIRHDIVLNLTGF